MSLIEKIVKKVLKEVRTQQKGEFNRGMEHRIYPSKSNPNRLFKVGDIGVTHWVKIFDSNPDIFATFCLGSHFIKYASNEVLFG